MSAPKRVKLNPPISSELRAPEAEVMCDDSSRTLVSEQEHHDAASIRSMYNSLSTTDQLDFVRFIDGINKSSPTAVTKYTDLFRKHPNLAMICRNDFVSGDGTYKGDAFDLALIALEKNSCCPLHATLSHYPTSVELITAIVSGDWRHNCFCHRATETITAGPQQQNSFSTLAYACLNGACWEVVKCLTEVETGIADRLPNREDDELTPLMASLLCERPSVDLICGLSEAYPHDIVVDCAWGNGEVNPIDAAWLIQTERSTEILRTLLGNYPASELPDQFLLGRMNGNLNANRFNARACPEKARILHAFLVEHNLETVISMYDNWTEDGLLELMNLLRTNPKILDLSVEIPRSLRSSLAIQQAHARMIRESPSLEAINLQLYLHISDSPDPFFESFCSAFVGTTRQISVCLRYGHIYAAEGLAEMFRNAPGIYLDNICMTPSAARTLAHAISTSEYIHCLSLECSYPQSVESKALVCDAVIGAAGDRLETLELICPDFISTRMDRWTSLSSLVVDFQTDAEPEYASDVKQSLRTLLKENLSLKEIKLGGWIAEDAFFFMAMMNRIGRERLRKAGAGIKDLLSLFDSVMNMSNEETGLVKCDVTETEFGAESFFYELLLEQPALWSTRRRLTETH